MEDINEELQEGKIKTILVGKQNLDIKQKLVVIDSN